MSTRTFLLIRSIALVSSVFLAIASSLLAQEKVAWSDQEKADRRANPRVA
jgi:hypothetical protein